MKDDSQSAVARLPPELLSHIFTQDPLLASHVSHRWRVIARDDPRLWVCPTLTISPHTPLARLHVLDLFLRRSAMQPLQITLVLDPFTQPEPITIAMAAAALDLLALHASRWASLSISLPADLFGPTFCALLSILPKGLPALRTAHITLGGSSIPTANGAHSEPSASAFLARAPALRDLTWTHRAEYTSWDLSSSGDVALGLGEAWAGLTRIVLNTFVGLPIACAVLMQAPSLAHFEMRNFGTGVRVGAVEESVAPGSWEDMKQTDTLRVMPALRTLSVYQPTLDTALPALLSRLVCPALQRLSITCGFLPDGDASQTIHTAGVELVAFVRRCVRAEGDVRRYEYENAQIHEAWHSSNADMNVHPPTGLQELALEGTGISPAHLAECLSLAQKLCRLEVYAGRGGAAVDDEVLCALGRGCEVSAETGNVKASEKPLCPHLAALVLHHTVTCADGALEAMLRARLGEDRVPYGRDETERCGYGDKSKIHIARLREVDVVLGRRLGPTNARDVAFLNSLRRGRDEDL